MEVHKHPHHVTHKKKWGEYFLEFLMIFFAVFLGFVAENIRENIVEKERARQYIEAFYRDIKTDTTTFSRIIKSNQTKLLAFHDIFKCYDSIKKNWKSTACLIPILTNSRDYSVNLFSEGTIQQLKNAGGFRMLSNEDRDSIMKYDNLFQQYKDFESTILQPNQDLVRNTFSMAGDFESNKFLYPKRAGADSSHKEMPLLFSDNKVLLNTYFNDLLRYEAGIIGQNILIKTGQGRAKKLLAYFKNKYHLE